MSYQGWNRAELLAAGSKTGGLSNIRHHTVASFTPLTQRRTPLPSLPPSRPLNPTARSLEGDSLYNLRETPAPEIPNKSSKSRKSVPKDCMVSLGAVWENEDGEDIHSDGVAFEEPLPKRKKTTISKRSQSMKIPPMNTENWDDDRPGIANQNHGQASQLTTPPDSVKRKNGKAGPAELKPKTKLTPPFKNPTITKPSVARGKVAAQEIRRANTIISHNGWRSTEDNVKSTPVILAMTTMEKLAAFRFEPPGGLQITPVAEPSLQRLADEPEDLPPHESLEDTSSNHDLPSDSFFDEALWAVVAPAKFSDNDHVQPEPAMTRLATETPKNLQHPTPDIGTGTYSPGAELVVAAQTHAGSGLVGPRPGSLSQDHYELTSSDTRVMHALIVPTQLALGKLAESAFEYMIPTPSKTGGPSYRSEDGNHVAMEDRVDVGEVQLVAPDSLHSHETLPESGVEHHDVDNSSIQTPKTCDGPNSGLYSNLHVTSPSSNINDEELPRPRKTFNVHQILGRSAIEIQVERSDVDEPEASSKIHWGSDEFDQGLDDGDLLAIVSESFVPQTPPEAFPEQQKNAKICSRFLLPPTVALKPRTHDAPAQQYAAALNANNTDSPSPRELSSSDEEFPLDDEEEEEMLKLSDIGAGAKESFPPSESARKRFHLLEEREVYDSSLQFSSPKSQTSGVSPSQVAKGRHIDKNRATHSPPLRKDYVLLGEAEDCSFTPSNTGNIDADAPNMSDSFYDSAPAVRPVIPRAASSTLTTRSIAGHENRTTVTQLKPEAYLLIIDDSHEYELMKPFARPDFPALVLDRSPVVGLAPQTYLRTCFRVGELFKEGVRCGSLGHDAVFELFARVTFSSRETGSTKQHFQFADLWHDRPPYPNGVLGNYKTTGLAESESKVFLTEKGKMARCLGRFKRDIKKSIWVLYIINIRETDWEEIRWTKEVVSHGQVKAERGGLLRHGEEDDG